MRSKRIDAVIIQPTLLNQRAVELALKYRLPLFSLARTIPGTGGLMSYAADQVDLLSSISTDLSLWRAILGPAYGARFREFFMTEQY